jgi:hypothetical protein
MSAPAENMERFVSSIGSDAQELVRQSIRFLEDPDPLSQMSSSTDPLGTCLGLMDFVSIALVWSNLSTSEFAQVLREVRQRTELTMGGIGFCGCNDPGVEETHNNHHVGMAMQFLECASTRAERPLGEVQLDVQLLCCDPQVVALILARTSMTVIAERRATAPAKVIQTVRRALGR